MKKLIIFCIIVVLVVAGGWYFLKKVKTKQSTGPQSSHCYFGYNQTDS